MAVVELGDNDERLARSPRETVGEEEESVDNVDKSVVVDGFVVDANVSSQEVGRVECKSEISEDVDAKISSNEVMLTQVWKRKPR